VRRDAGVGSPVDYPTTLVITSSPIPMLEFDMPTAAVGASTEPPWRPPIGAVNFHVWLACNMACGFCFGRFQDVRSSVLPEGHLPREDAVRLVQALAAAGFLKITFAGGEPLLCPWLAELVIQASHQGMVTSMVTNGSLLTEERMIEFRGALHWLTLSVDSTNPQILAATGRRTRRRAMSEDDYAKLVFMARSLGARVKINTVVSSHNRDEDMSSTILRLRPERWKLLQVLRIEEQNDAQFERHATSAEQFWSFVRRHEHVGSQGVVIVPEDNQAMTESYVMVDPAGRFFDNVSGRYCYSSPMLHCGVQTAFEQIRVSREAFIARGGDYDWTGRSQHHRPTW
jgi:radical S-adenosyl methionine domain-containing protein 2